MSSRSTRQRSGDDQRRCPFRLPWTLKGTPWFNMWGMRYRTGSVRKAAEVQKEFGNTALLIKACINQMARKTVSSVKNEVYPVLSRDIKDCKGC
jgi:hypothetical protein